VTWSQCFSTFFELKKIGGTLTCLKLAIWGTLSSKTLIKDSKYNIWRHHWHLFTAPLCAAASQLGSTALSLKKVIKCYTHGGSSVFKGGAWGLSLSTSISQKFLNNFDVIILIRNIRNITPFAGPTYYIFGFINVCFVSFITFLWNNFDAIYSVYMECTEKKRVLNFAKIRKSEYSAFRRALLSTHSFRMLFLKLNVILLIQKPVVVNYNTKQVLIKTIHYHLKL